MANNLYWNAEIETKTTFKHSKWMQVTNNEDDEENDVKSKEKRIFSIKINRLSQMEDHATFKIKTSVNIHLISEELNTFIKDLYREYMPTINDPFWKCMYHGRNKRLALILVGCESYNGLLIVNENLYMVSPWLNSSKNSYKIELIEPTTKYNTTTDQILYYVKLIQNKSQVNTTMSSQNSPSLTTASTTTNNFKKVNLKINLDKTLFNEYLLTNTARLDEFIRHLTIKMHLVWSYYYYEHEVNFRIEKIELVNYASSSNNNKRKLFNIDPDQFLKNKNSTQTQQQTNDLTKIFTELLSKNIAQSYINVYEVPEYILSPNEVYKGVATQSTISYCNKESPSSAFGQRASMILIKNNFDLIETNFLRSAIEQSNVIIELLGYNFGNRNKKQTCDNWYFQVIQLENDLNLGDSTCTKRSIDIYKDCKELKEREQDLFKTRNHCGNGIVETELDEQCDCGNSTNPYEINSNYSDCNLNCCDMRTCKFRSETMQCASGICCNEKCLFKPSTQVCRDMKTSSDTGGSCDFVEFCSGQSSECPVDRFAHNGISCNDKENETKSGYCWQGECKLSASNQCKSIWSIDSTSSDLECYKKFNTIGFENGNCGIVNNSTKSYIKCEPADAQCGLLNCQYGIDKPLIKTLTYAKSTTNLKDDIQYECKVVPNPPVYVNDGSRCDFNSEVGICISKKCLRLNDIINPKDRLNKCISNRKNIDAPFVLCSNNGICDNQQVCNCFSNWTGKYCESSIEDNESLNTFDINFKKSSSNTKLPMLSIIGVVSLFFMLVLLFGFIFCRNRATRKKRKQGKTIYNESDHSKNSFMNLSENHFELSLTKVNQAIQKLKTQPSKSILKKVSDSASAYHSQNDLNSAHLRDTSFQVNLNTLINAGLVECPQPQSKSLKRKNKLVRNHSSASSSSCSSIECSNNNNNSKRYSISISSSLSKHIDQPENQLLNEISQESSYEEDIHNITTSQHNMSYAMKKDLSLLTLSSTSSHPSLNNLSDSSSLSLSEKTLKIDTNKCGLNENLQVQDFLNELNLLSNQNTFALSKNIMKEEPLDQTILRHDSPKKANLLNLNVNTKNNVHDDHNGFIHTNSSETSSGYLSFSAMNIFTNNTSTNKIATKIEPRQSLSPNPIANIEKRFSYTQATASSNNLNAPDLVDCE